MTDAEYLRAHQHALEAACEKAVRAAVAARVDHPLAAIAEKLEAEETARLGQEEQYGSLQEEIESKTKKLKKLYAKFKAAQAEIEKERTATQTPAQKALAPEPAQKPMLQRARPAQEPRPRPQKPQLQPHLPPVSGRAPH